MTIANTVTHYLADHEIPYEVVSHRHTASSLDTAQAAHIPGDRMAKSVILEDERGYLMAVLPATCRVDLGELQRHFSRKLTLATESEVAGLFQDCDFGAVPPVGPAYGMETVVDHVLTEQPEIWFEGGDHERLIHVSGEAFEAMLAEVEHCPIGRHI